MGNRGIEHLSGIREISYDRRVREWLAFIAAISAMLFAGLGGYRPLTTHEVYVAQTAREMLARNDWIVPTCFDEVRLKKPPMAYWQTMLAFKVFGVNDWSARLPSALAGLAQAMLLAWFVGKLHGQAIGFTAGFLQVASVATLTQARLAEADMTLALWVEAALIAFAMTLTDSAASRRRVWTFWIAVTLAFLSKGPVALLFIFGTIATTCVVLKSVQPARSLLRPLPMIVCAIAIAIWPVAVWLQHPQAIQIWQNETLDRFARDPNGVVRIPGYYAIAALWLTLPWTPLWIGELLQLRKSRRSRVDIFLLCWVAVPMVLLSMSAGKQEHYLIPALPPLAIFAAHGWRRWALVSWNRQRGFPQGNRRPIWNLSAVQFATFVVVGVVAFEVWLMPRMNNRRPQSDWFAVAARNLPASQPCGLVGHSVLWLGFYGPRELVRFDSVEDLNASTNQPKYTLTTAELVSRMSNYRVVDSKTLKQARASTSKDPVLLERFDDLPTDVVNGISKSSVIR